MFKGYTLEALWLDVELPITEAAVNAALIQCDAYQGQLTGIYSGKWFFDNQGWSHQSFWSSRPLWDSNYNGVPVTEQGFVSYGGWSSCVIKQYQGTSAIGHLSQIDLDVEG